MMSGKRSPWSIIGMIVGVLVILVWCLLPVAWIISVSFKPENPVGNPGFLPEDWTWDNYDSVIHNEDFRRALINSFGISLIATVLSVALATLCAYAIARLDFKGKRLVLSLALAIAMFPVVSLIGPLFDQWTALGLYDTWPGLIISLTSSTNARPVPAQLAFFVGPDQFNPAVATISAASVIVTVPIIIIVLLFQRRIVSGLTSGAVKG
jgi:multiple sugar transport system permease protein